MIRVPVPALLALGCLPLLGACTSAPTGAAEPGAVPAPPVRPSVTAAPAPTLAALPDPATSARPVVAVTATQGPATLGTVDLRPGQLWISLDCVADEGPGHLAVILESGSRIDIDCPGDEVYVTRNLDQDGTGGPTGVRVEAGPDVRWNLLIEQ